MKQLKGLCKNCLGCQRLENEKFDGVFECEYNFIAQIEISDLKSNKEDKTI